ncbi:MAG: hypothetical protein AABX13_03375 [Nanoarchaeota archaeon]
MAQDLFYVSPEYKSDLLKEFEFQEEVREGPVGQYNKTGFPQPVKFYRLSWEVYDLSLEEPYFWVLEELKRNFPLVEKLEDSFAAAENSAFFGITQQRLGAQQDRVSTFLATIGKMIKELFQMVRELRIIDERLKYYGVVEEEIQKPIEQRKKGDEITLKGLFVDLVQQGAKSPASVFGMARELEFITLPDLFFDAPPFRNQDELEAHVNSLEKNFNRNVLRVLIRHLTQYQEWRKRTHKEHQSRRRFMLAYLRQHFDIIKMYVNWIRPYLRHVSRLHLKESNMTKADLVSAFEGSMLDVEVLARKRDDKTKANGCILATFNYRTRPELKVVQEGYQRGPVHIGRFEMNLRIYKWKDKEVEAYKKLKEKETIFLMGEVSESVQKAMESLGEELDHYLAETEGKVWKEVREGKEGTMGAKAEPSKKSFAERFFGDFYTPKKPQGKQPSKKEAKLKSNELEAAFTQLVDMPGGVRGLGWNAFHNFKKAHRLIAW